jgi:hypothetical protein
MHGDSLATTDNQAMVWDSRKASLITAVGAPGRTAAVGGTGGRCLGVAGNATGNGAATELQDCNGTPNQVWQYNLDTSGPRVFQFKQAASGRCLTVRGGGTANGAVLELWDCADNAAYQVWRFAPEGTLVNTVSGRCVDLAGYGTGAGAAVQLYDCNPGWTNQVWRARADGSLFSPQAARCIDVAGGGTADGTVIQSYYWLGQLRCLCTTQDPDGVELRRMQVISPVSTSRARPLAIQRHSGTTKN